MDMLTMCKDKWTTIYGPFALFMWPILMIL
jgi:hypothetical protein